LPNDDGIIRAKLRELAQKHRRWGCPMLHIKLKQHGIRINHKRTERLYRLEKLQVRKRRRIKRSAELRVALPKAVKPGHIWGMDFIWDALTDGRRFKNLVILDIYTRRDLAIETDTSINAVRVVRVLNELALRYGLPEIIVMDNGPEFRSKALDAWAYERGVKMHFIEPGKPVQNAYVESFNDKFRHECLNDNCFFTLIHAKGIIEKWRQEYNGERPHSSLGGLTPEEFTRLEQDKTMAGEAVKF
jgi:putative transposase